tara:strand:- start:1842 stop:2429 length:588 start_codon:yes stop_codon:yes gene_type:complete
MDKMKNNIREILVLNPLVPVVTFHENDDPLAFMEFLLKQNVNCIEITLRTNSGLSAIESIKKEFDTVKVGAGTVINGDQVKILRDLGADFMVSPGTTKKLIKEFINSEVPFINGVSTASEIILAKELGLNTLKFFPAHLYGGIDAIKMFGQLFPDVKFCPTGGINEQSSKEYLEQSNVIAVGGSWFQKEYKNLRK